MLFKIWNDTAKKDSDHEDRIWDGCYPFPAYPTRKDLQGYGAIFHRNEKNKIVSVSLFIEDWHWNGEEERHVYHEFVFFIKRLD